MYLSIFYCFCFVDYISDNIVEKQVMYETDPYFEREKDFSISDDR